MAGYIHWYIVIISAYYSLIIRPVGKDYLLSSIQYGWCYVSFVVIIIRVTIFFDVVIQIEIDCTGPTVFVLTFHYKQFFTKVLIADFLAVAKFLGAYGYVCFVI